MPVRHSYTHIGLNYVNARRCHETNFDIGMFVTNLANDINKKNLIYHMKMVYQICKPSKLNQTMAISYESCIWFWNITIVHDIAVTYEHFRKIKYF